MEEIKTILKQYESGCLTLTEVWYKLNEATANERYMLLLLKKELKSYDDKTPMEIAESLLWIQEQAI